MLVERRLLVLVHALLGHGHVLDIVVVVVMIMLVVELMMCYILRVADTTKKSVSETYFKYGEAFQYSPS